MRRRRKIRTSDAQVVSLRRAAYTVKRDTVFFHDELLGQYELGGLILKPLNGGPTHAVSKMQTVFSSSGTIQQDGYMLYMDTRLDPAQAKSILWETLRDTLESHRMALNDEVRRINRVLELLD